MAGFDGLLDLIPVGDIAKQFGIPESVAESAIEQIIPAVVGGLAANAETDSGAKSLEKALVQHEGKVAKGKVKVENIDTADGGKIVSHVFGAKTQDVAAAVADANSSSDVTKDLIAQLLPVVAPSIIGFIANQFLGQKTAAPAAEAAPAASSSGGIGDLLGGLLGSQGGQQIIGSVLGGLLGGGTK